MKNFLQKLVDILNEMYKTRFTGTLILTLKFNQGGIRGVKKYTQESLRSDS